MKTYTGFIEKLLPNQIFVFGSNKQGIHGAGTALQASIKYGAKLGLGVGLNGQSYGLVTVDLYSKKRPSISKEEIIKNIETLYNFAKNNPNKELLVAYTAGGYNLNGYTSKEMAAMFGSFKIPENMFFEDKFAELIKLTLK